MTAVSDESASWDVPWPDRRLEVKQYIDFTRRLGATPPGYRIPVAACDRWAGDPDRRALLDLTGPDPRWWTFADIQARSRRLANGLRAGGGTGPGVAVGDRVAVLLPQGADAAVAHLAIYRLGAVAVPLSTMYGADAISHRLADSGAVMAITELGIWERLRAEGLGDACRWVVTTPPGADSGSLPAGVLSYAQLCAEGSESLDDAPIGAESPAMIVYTSGTTGPPKGAVHPHRVVAAHAAPIRLAHNGFPAPGDLLWSPADWAWAGGLIDCLLSAWHAGVPIVAYRGTRFDAAQALDMMVRWNVRNTFLPPTALRLMRDAIEAGAAVPTLRSLMTGGEPVSAEISTWSAQRLGVVPNAVFGQTEASCIVGNCAPLLEVRPGSLGQPYPGSDVRILDGNGAELPAGETGEIAVRADSPAVFLGYWQQPAATADKLRDGWLLTGDLGRRDEDGYFWFVSRRDDLILSAGYRIGPGEVEACLEQHPAVAAAAVVGHPDVERGHVVKAYVVRRPPAAAEAIDSEALAQELRQHVRSRLAPYEVPRIVEFVDELPRTTTGKVMRGALRTTNPPTMSQVD